MKNRIEKILKEEKIASSKFADEIGIQRSSMSHILSGRNNPSLDIIQRILRKYPHINSDWLVLGVGDMYAKSTSKLSLFDDINDIEEDLPKQQTENVIEETNTIKEESQTEYVTNIPMNKAIIQEKKIKKIMIFYNDGSFEEIVNN
jgi:transcriptional regulator with XRE-family HTH domain